MIGKTLSEKEACDLMLKGGKLVRCGVYLDATAEYKAGTSTKTGKDYEIKNASLIVKFGDEEAVTVSFEMPDEKSVEEFRKNAKPFAMGDKVVVVLREQYRSSKTYKIEARGESIHLLNTGKASA